MLKQKGALITLKTICFRKGYLLLSTLSFLINRGQNTEFILEIFAEILGVVKAQLIRYLRYILLTLAQHLRRSFQTDDTDKFNRCLTGYLLRVSCKDVPAHTQPRLNSSTDKSHRPMFASTYLMAFSTSFSSNEVMAISLGSGSMSDFALLLAQVNQLAHTQNKDFHIEGFVT